MWHESVIFFWYHYAPMSRNNFPYLFSFSTVASGIIFRFYFSFTTIQNLNSKVSICKYLINSFMCFLHSSIHIWLYTRTIDLSGNIEKNQGPRSTSPQRFLICYCNRNSLIAYCWVKTSLLKAYLSIRKFDIVWLSERYRDPSVPLHDNNLELQGYELDQSDHPLQHESGSVCIYLRN